MKNINSTDGVLIFAIITCLVMFVWTLNIVSNATSTIVPTTISAFSA